MDGAPFKDWLETRVEYVRQSTTSMVARLDCSISGIDISLQLNWCWTYWSSKQMVAHQRTRIGSPGLAHY